MLHFQGKLCEVSAVCFKKWGDKSDISLNLFMSSYSLSKEASGIFLRIFAT